jgi:hypothetical protein
MTGQERSTSPEDDDDADYREWQRDIESKKQKILRAPAVRSKLKALAEAGADAEKLLLGLAIVVPQDSRDIHKHLKGRRQALTRMAERLETDSAELGKIFSNSLNFSSVWKALLFSFAISEFPDTEKLKQLPAGLIARMQSFASALRGEERILADLIRLHPRVTDNYFLAGIVSYIKAATGNFHDELFADLLQAAHSVLGSEKQFSAESLKKFRQRHVPSLIRSRKKSESYDSNEWSAMLGAGVRDNSTPEN